MGDAKAQYELGRIYMVGLGVSQDYQQATKWYEGAAEEGFAAAQFMMGFLYEQGKGYLPNAEPKPTSMQRPCGRRALRAYGKLRAPESENP